MTEPTQLPTASVAQLRSARRLLQRKQRERTGTFLVDGPQAVRECATTSELIVCSPAAVDRHGAILASARDADVPVVVSDEVDTLSDAVTPQGIVAVHRLITVDQLPPGEGIHVIAAQIRDPGNLGTLIRCADAFGAAAVLLTAGSVDPHNPKTVRASVGSLFHLPIVAGLELGAAVDAVHALGSTVLAADGTGERDLDQLAVAGELSRPTTWLFGNEAWGLPETDRALADEVIRVPMWGQAESLNLATAAAVCLYTTAATQRRSSP